MDIVETAMQVLLNKKQIKYVKSQTFAGPSRVQVISRLINIGIRQEEKMREEDKKIHEEWLKSLTEKKVKNNV